MSKLVYIVDDEENIRKLVSLGLQDAGFATRAFADGTAFLAEVRYRLPDAVILDWMMPQPDGLALCRTLRADATTRALPILMLTAKSDEIDRILGLELGADDYITKPFSVKELAARVRALLRRDQYLTSHQEQLLTYGPLQIDLDRRTVTKRGITVELTLKEFDLLAMLLRHRGRVLTREMLLEHVWGSELGDESRTVDVHIRYLRQKIEDKPDEPELILTVRGLGYRLSEENYS